MNWGAISSLVPELIKARRWWVLAAMVSGVSLFTPVPRLLGADTFVQQYRSILAVVFYGSLCGAIVLTLADNWQRIDYRWQERRERKKLERRVHNLSHAERDIIAPFVEEDILIRKLDRVSTIVDKLTRDGVLILNYHDRISGLSSYKLDPRALDYLRKHKNLVSEASTKNPA